MFVLFSLLFRAIPERRTDAHIAPRNTKWKLYSERNIRHKFDFNNNIYTVQSFKLMTARSNVLHGAYTTLPATHTHIHSTAAQMFIACALLKHFLIGKLNRNHLAEPGDKQTYTHQRRLMHSLNHHSLTE